MFFRSHRTNMVAPGILGFIAGVVLWEIFGKRIKRELKTNPEIAEIKGKIKRAWNEGGDNL